MENKKNTSGRTPASNTNDPSNNLHDEQCDIDMGAIDEHSGKLRERLVPEEQENLRGDSTFAHEDHLNDSRGKKK